MPVTARTQVVGSIGYPIAHGLSPTMHNAAFESLQLDWVYVAFPVLPEHGPGAVDAMRTLGIRGLNVTMPHKEVTAATCDELSDTGARLRAINTLVLRDDATVFGDSTDGRGFVRACDEEGIALRGVNALVLGAGGAARSIVDALGTQDAQITVVARNLDAAKQAADMAPGANALGFPLAQNQVHEFDLIVQCTPVGMKTEEPLLPSDAFRSGQTLIDLIYSPAVTSQMKVAKAAGAQVHNGLSMLLHQGALSFELWTGQSAPIGVMREALSQAHPPVE